MDKEFEIVEIDGRKYKQYTVPNGEDDYTQEYEDLETGEITRK